MLEKANSDYDGKFRAFVDRRTNGRKQAISALRNEAGISTLESHYQDLGSSSVFDDGWKQEVESRVRDCMSHSCEDGVLDGDIEIARCLHTALKIIRLEGVMG